MYLVRFYQVRQEVCGRDISWPSQPRIEQEWDSVLLQKRFSFSAFAYCFISLTLTMDEWFDDRFYSSPSEWEKQCIAQLAMKQMLRDESAVSARCQGNDAILHFVEMVRSLLEMGIAATAHRIGATKNKLIGRWGQEPQMAVRYWLAAQYR